MLSVTLDRSASEPLVRQIYHHVRELILTRRLPAGARLPSTRKLAHDLEVSRTVAVDAFAQLSADGFLDAAVGAGHFVAALPLASDPPPVAAITTAVSDDQASIWEPKGRPFDPAWQNVELFPSQLWARMLGRGWRRHQAVNVERHWGGLPPLREAVAEHLHALRGAPLRSDQVLITAGNADILTLIARSLPRDGQAAAWVEDPGLGSARQTLQREGVHVVPVPVDDEGLVVSAGERLAPDASMALVTPTRQFPLGMPMSLPRRLSLLSWSRRTGAVLVDDDYDGEMRFAGRPLPSLASLDPGASVLTLGSFSKLTYSGLRLGYAAAPADLIGRLIEARRESYAMVPTNSQAGLAEFIGTGGFARHLRKLRTELTRRRRTLHQLLTRDAGGLLQILPQQAGMHLTVRLTGTLAGRATDTEIAELARARGIVLLPLSQQYASGQGENGFLLGYAGWSENQLEDATQALLGLLREIART
jgi:GntR family transcriptional regulator/MocR family aminotransferase